MIKTILALLIFLFGILCLSPNTLGEVSAYESYQFKLNAWIDNLIQFESNGNEDLKFLDSNGKYSYSCLQFQEATFNQESARYNVEGQIMDCDTQKRIAKAMITDDWNNWRHWYTSVKVRKMGYPPKIEI